jgi:beta-phosphoglucomutase-like phosphatase (HAD superfamily)
LRRRRQPQTFRSTRRPLRGTEREILLRRHQVARDAFEVRVDGNVIQAQRLAGKPAPDTFLMAAKLLGVEPIRAVVIEDAISGVEAGSNGKFGLVIGVARKGNPEELKHHGAQLVVDDLAELVD